MIILRIFKKVPIIWAYSWFKDQVSWKNTMLAASSLTPASALLHLVQVVLEVNHHGHCRIPSLPFLACDKFLIYDCENFKDRHSVLFISYVLSTWYSLRDTQIEKQLENNGWMGDRVNNLVQLNCTKLEKKISLNLMVKGMLFPKEHSTLL